MEYAFCKCTNMFQNEIVHVVKHVYLVLLSDKKLRELTREEDG